MALKETIHTLRQLLTELQNNLDKAEKGNLAAAQRVRTRTIKFAKMGKLYRKESLAMEKKQNQALKKKMKKTRK